MSWLHKALKRAQASEQEGEIDLLSEIGGVAETSQKDDFTMSMPPVSQKDPDSTSAPTLQTKREKMDIDIMQKNKVILPDMTSMHLIEQYKVLRAQVFNRAEDKHWRTIMITSLRQGEGKTLTSINLSIVIAQELHQTVLLVDSDLRKPSVLSFFGIKETMGLSDHLLKDIPIPELLINPGIDSFTIFPGGMPVQNTAEILRSVKMASLVKEFKGRYDDRYVIFDTPPLLLSTDALVLSKYMDAVILVVEVGKTTKRDLERGREFLEWMNLLGVVLNKGALTEKSYY